MTFFLLLPSPVSSPASQKTTGIGTDGGFASLLGANPLPRYCTYLPYLRAAAQFRTTPSHGGSRQAWAEPEGLVLWLQRHEASRLGGF